MKSGLILMSRKKGQRAILSMVVSLVGYHEKISHFGLNFMGHLAFFSVFSCLKENIFVFVLVLDLW